MLFRLGLIAVALIASWLLLAPPQDPSPAHTTLSREPESTSGTDVDRQEEATVTPSPRREAGSSEPALPWRREIQVLLPDGSPVPPSRITLRIEEEPGSERFVVPLTAEPKPSAVTDAEGRAALTWPATSRVRLHVRRAQHTTLFSDPIAWLDDSPIVLRETPPTTIEVKTVKDDWVKQVGDWFAMVSIDRRLGPEDSDPSRGLTEKVLKETLRFEVGAEEWRVRVVLPRPHNDVVRTITPWRSARPGGSEVVFVDPSAFETKHIEIRARLDEEPLPDCGLTLHPIDVTGSDDRTREPVSSRSDASGLFRFDMFPGRYRAVVHRVGGNPLSISSDLMVQPTDGDPIEIRWRSAELPFRLEWSDGSPATDVSIDVSPNPEWIRAASRPSGPDGTGKLRFVEGSVELSWWPAGHRPYAVGVQLPEPHPLGRVSLQPGKNPERTFVLDATLR